MFPLLVLLGVGFVLMRSSSSGGSENASRPPAGGGSGGADGPVDTTATPTGLGDAPGGVSVKVEPTGISSATPVTDVVAPTPVVDTLSSAKSMLTMASLSYTDWPAIHALPSPLREEALAVVSKLVFSPFAAAVAAGGETAVIPTYTAFCKVPGDCPTFSQALPVYEKMFKEFPYGSSFDIEKAKSAFYEFSTVYRTLWRYDSSKPAATGVLVEPPLVPWTGVKLGG